MIVWLKAEATGRPNDQRAEINDITYGDDRKPVLHVTMLGDDLKTTARIADICKIELEPSSDSLTVVAVCKITGMEAYMSR